MATAAAAAAAAAVPDDDGSSAIGESIRAKNVSNFFHEEERGREVVFMTSLMNAAQRQKNVDCEIRSRCYDIGSAAE